MLSSLVASLVTLVVCVLGHFQKTSVIRAKLDEAESRINEVASNPKTEFVLKEVNKVIQDDNIITRVDPAIKKAVNELVQTVLTGR